MSTLGGVGGKVGKIKLANKIKNIFSDLLHFSMIFSRSIHVIASGNILFYG